SKPVEDRAVAIAEYHLMAVEERIVVVAVEMDRSNELHPLSIDGIALKGFHVEFEGHAQSVIGLVHRDVGACFLTFRPEQAARQALGVVRSVDGALYMASDRGGGLRGTGRHQLCCRPP